MSADRKSSSKSKRIVGCLLIILILVLCAAFSTAGYLFLPDDYRTTTSVQTQVAQVFWTAIGTPTVTGDLSPQVATATLNKVPTFTPTPTSTPTVRSSPTLPPTDTPLPRPTETLTLTPRPPTFTPDPAINLAATEVAEAIIDVVLAPEALNGSISLVGVENKHVFAPGVGQVEFSWIWSGGCDLLPDGYGFDLRIWPNRPDFGPLGVTDVNTIQEEMVCIPESGKYVYRLYYLSGVPAVQLQGAGSFLWDVAFVKLSPYTPLYASDPREFEISLNYPNPGPLDPNGAPGSVTCASFSSWAEAQAFYIAAGGPQSDKFNLDPERNGIACNGIAPCLLTQDIESCKSRF